MDWLTPEVGDRIESILCVLFIGLAGLVWAWRVTR